MHPVCGEPVLHMRSASDSLTTTVEHWHETTFVIYAAAAATLMDALLLVNA